MHKLLSLALLSFILAGCTNKQLYHVGQDYQKSKCIEDAGTEQQHKDCSNLDKKPFEEYDKERKDIINN